MPRSTRRRRSLRGGQMMLTDIPMTQSANALYGQPDLITQPPWPSNSRPSDGRGTSTGMGGGSRIRKRRRSRRRSRRQRGGGGGDSTSNGGNGNSNSSTNTADKTGSDDATTPSTISTKTPVVKNSTAESFHSQFALVGGRRTKRRRSGRKRSGRKRSGRKRRRSGRRRSRR